MGQAPQSNGLRVISGPTKVGDPGEILITRTATGLQTSVDGGPAAPLGGVPPGDVALTDTYGVLDDAPAINSALATLAANGGGTLYPPAGTHRLKSQVNITTNGIRIAGGARDRCIFLVDDSAGNIGDGFQIKNTYGVELRDFTINAQSQRTAGNGIHVVGGDPAKTVVGLPLKNSGTLIKNVDMSGQFTGIFIERDQINVYENWRVYIEGGYHGFTSNGGQGIWINDPGGASHFVEKWYFAQGSGTPTAGIRLTGTGDVTLTNNEVFGANYALLMDPGSGGILACVTILGGFYDTGGIACMRIAPNAGASMCGVIKAIGAWMGTSAGNAAEIVGSAVKGAHFTNCTFSGATAGWAMLVDGASDVDFQGCHFSAASVGGLKFTNSASRFTVQGSKFLTREHVGSTPNSLPIGIQIDAGSDHYSVTGNNLSDAGIVTKITNTPGLAAAQRIVQDNVTA
jgi:hypothetical protein